MNNDQYAAPQHELNVISSLLRDRRNAPTQLINWKRPDLQYWLKPHHFQTPWLRDIYEGLVNEGFSDIERELQRSPLSDPAHVIADALIDRIRSRYQQRAQDGERHAQAALGQPRFWAVLHDAVKRLAQPTWPSHPQHTRHDAYVMVCAARYPSAVQDVPFELTRARDYDNEARLRELAVIGAILNDVERAEKFRYTTVDPDASPYWLQPSDFGDPVTAEIWDALVTGPDPAIALPAATDHSLTPEQRVTAMIHHIATRLDYNDYHRSTGDQNAQARLKDKVNQSIAACLQAVSAMDFSPNPDNAAPYAVAFILEPSITAAVEDLAGRVRYYGLADASLGQIGLELGRLHDSLAQLGERLGIAPLAPTGQTGQERAAQSAPTVTPRGGQPSYVSLTVERSALLSLIQDPSQLDRPGRPGGTRSLDEQDFTLPEYKYYFNAIRSLPAGTATDPWLLADRARKLAHIDGTSLDNQTLASIEYAARTTTTGPVGPDAGHLITMTVRRTVRDASTEIEAAAALVASNPRAAVDQALQQLQRVQQATQATREALGTHERSVPSQKSQRQEVG